MYRICSCGMDSTVKIWSMKGKIFSFMVVARMLFGYDLFYGLCILLTLSNIPIRMITWTLPLTIVFVVSFKFFVWNMMPHPVYALSQLKCA